MKKKILLFFWLLFPILGFSQIYYEQLQPIEVSWLKSTGQAAGLIPVADGSNGVGWSAAPSGGYDSIRFNSVDYYLRAYMGGVVVDSTNLLWSLTASLITDFDTEVANNTAVAANTAKVSFPGFSSLIADYGFTDNSTNWNTAYGWGNHALANYLTQVDTTATNIVDANWRAYIANHTGLGTVVTSVNTQTGDVVLNTSHISEVTNLYYTEARVAANSAVAANTAKVTNATHTGEVTGSTTLTIADNVVAYSNVSDSLKSSATNNTLTWDISANGIIYCTPSTGTVSFTNEQVNKTLCVVLTLSSATITWPATAKILDGSATLADGTFYVYIHCISSTIFTVSITKEAV